MDYKDFQKTKVSDNRNVRWIGLVPLSHAKPNLQILIQNKPVPKPSILNVNYKRSEYCTTFNSSITYIYSYRK